MTEVEQEPDITEITKDFGEVYRFSKEWESLKSQAQKAFFDEATRLQAQGKLPQKVIDAPDVEDLIEWAKLYHPGWVIIDVDVEGDKLILEQDPKLMEFVFVNPEDGYTYKRSQTNAAPQLDDERLKEEDPELYWNITEWRPDIYSWLKALADDHLPDFDLEDWLSAASIGESIRTFKDQSTWTDDQASKLQKYLVPGKVGVKLEPPRLTKKDDGEEKT